MNRKAEAKFLKGLLVIAVVLLGAKGIGAEKPKARTVDELAKMYDVSSCKECHAEIYEQWEKSLHARSIIGTPRTADACGRLWKA